ncbi:hypothetical protein RQP46_005058 [Phenoliferia psychrophenolica]
MVAAQTVPPIQYLADLADSLRSKAIAPEIRRQAVLCILDTLGCAIAGTTAAEPRMMLRAEQATAGSGGASTVIGSKLKVSSTAAARINAFAGDVFELNDLIGGHASIGNVSAVLALAEEVGSEVITALVAGLEVTTKLFNSYHPRQKPYSDSLMVSVALPSAVGGAAACGVILKLDATALNEALAIGAGTTSVCPGEIIFGNGGSVKPILFGALPADTSIRAAYLAQAGLTGPPNILESPMGYYSTICTAVNYGNLYTKESALAEGKITRKLHAACGHCHSALDAIVMMRAECGANWPPTAIEITTPPKVHSTVCLKDAAPTTPNEARFHIGYLIALIATSPTPFPFILPEHSLNVAEYLKDDHLVKVMSSITFVEGFEEETFYHTSSTKLILPDGTTKTRLVEAPRGSAANSLDEAGVIGKFSALAEPVLGKDKAREVVAAVLSLEGAASVGDVMELLAW